MTKIKITSEQYKSILLHEQISRLKTYDNVLNENLELGPEVLEEGWKEVLLGVAMLMGVGLTGVNKTMAQDALKNGETMAQIKATLEDKNKTQELVKSFGEKGMRNPEAILAKNAEKVVDNFNKVSDDNKLEYKVSNKVVTNLHDLDVSLSQGYALKKSEIGADTIKGETTNSIVTIVDTVELELGNDNLFSTGGFKLNSNGINIITNTLDSIQKTGGRILSLNIESSTDAERTPSLISSNDPTGNIRLASLRTKSVTDLFNDLDSNIAITHREIPNNGSDVVSTSQFVKNKDNKEALTALRAKTSEYRYVKLKMVVEFKQEVPEENPKPEDIVKKYRFELTKVYIPSDSKKIKFKGKKVKCNVKKRSHHKGKPIGRVAKCFIF